MMLTFLDFAFGFGKKNGGSIGLHLSLLSLLVRLIAFCSLGGSSISIMVGMGAVLRVTH